jgi:DNA-binding transcriptional MerR regulator
MDKSADAFRTISEVADHLDTPAHVLRFWESRFPQIRPVKRAGGRRYYRPADVSLLTGIKRLLHEDGMTIRGVQKILREQGVRHVSGLLSDGDASAHDDPAFDQIEDVVVAPEPDTVALRPAPDLAEAMAKAMDHRQSGPSQLISERQEPALADDDQGALILTASYATPVVAEDDPIATIGEMEEAAMGAALGHAVPTSQPQDMGPDQAHNANPNGSAQGSIERPVDDDFDEDFDAGPVVTLASRVRSLPDDATVAKIGQELVGVIARLQALRDAMADAARSDRG